MATVTANCLNSVYGSYRLWNELLLSLRNTYRVNKIQERVRWGGMRKGMQLDYSKVNQTTFTTHGMDGDYNNNWAITR